MEKIASASLICSSLQPLSISVFLYFDLRRHPNVAISRVSSVNPFGSVANERSYHMENGENISIAISKTCQKQETNIFDDIDKDQQA